MKYTWMLIHRQRIHSCVWVRVFTGRIAGVSGERWKAWPLITQPETVKLSKVYLNDDDWKCVFTLLAQILESRYSGQILVWRQGSKL